MISALRGLREIEAFERRIPVADLLLAASVGFLLINVMFISALILNLAQGFEFSQDLFESVSAAGTVGLSTGITPETSPFARLVLPLTMLTGRLGPLALVLALTEKERIARYPWPEESVKIG